MGNLRVVVQVLGTEFESPRLLVHIYKSISRVGCRGQEDSWSSLASYFSQINELQVQ